MTTERIDIVEYEYRKLASVMLSVEDDFSIIECLRTQPSYFTKLYLLHVANNGAKNSLTFVDWLFVNKIELMEGIM